MLGGVCVAAAALCGAGLSFDGADRAAGAAVFEATAVLPVRSAVAAGAVSQSLFVTGAADETTGGPTLQAYRLPHEKKNNVHVPLAGGLRAVALVRHCTLCGYALAACGPAGMQVINVSDEDDLIPYAPIAQPGTSVDALRVNGAISAFAIDKYGRDGAGGCVLMYDIRDPQHTAFVQAFPLAAGEAVADVAIDLNILLVAVNCPGGDCAAASRFELWDINAAPNATQLSSAPLPDRETDVAAAGVFFGTTAVLVGARGVYTYDIRNRAAPSFIDFVEFDAGAVWLGTPPYVFLGDTADPDFLVLRVSSDGSVHSHAYSSNALNASIATPPSVITAAQDDPGAIYVLYDHSTPYAASSSPSASASASSDAVLLVFEARSDDTDAPIILLLTAVGLLLAIGVAAGVARRYRGPRSAYTPAV